MKLSERILRKFTDGPDRYTDTPQAVADAADKLESKLAASRAQVQELEQSLADAETEAQGRDREAESLRAQVATLREALRDITASYIDADAIPGGWDSRAFSVARAALAATEASSAGTTANSGDEQDNVCQGCGDHRPCDCEAEPEGGAR